jgi:peptide/nickel transport system permease protein
MLRYILPNVAASIIVIATLLVANMIIFEASLSFLGLGVPSNIPTWGRIVADGREYVASEWWIALFAGLAILITVMGINLLGDWLREELDPKRRNR